MTETHRSTGRNPRPTNTRSWRQTGPGRARTCALVGLAAAALGLGCPLQLPGAGVGRPDYQARTWITVPGGHVNAASGNLWIRRSDLSVDTHVGEVVIAAVYNLQEPAWTWSFDVRYDGSVLVDASGARYDTTAVAPGAPIPGSHWVVLGPDRVRTKGGLVHEFDTDGRLAAWHWQSASHPRIRTRREWIAGEPRVTAIEQCVEPEDCHVLYALTRKADGRLIAVDDLASRRAEYEWDAQGRLTVARTPFEVARGMAGTGYGYDDLDRLTSVTSSEGERVEYGYEASRITSAELAGAGGVHRFLYPGRAGGLYTVIHRDPTDVDTTYRVDDLHRLHAMTDAAGDPHTFEWSGLRVTRAVAPDGSETHTTIEDDDPVAVSLPSGNLVATRYAPAAEDRRAPNATPIASRSDLVGELESREYDAQGRLVAHRNGEGDETRYAWGPFNQILSFTSPAGIVTELRDRGDHGHPALVRYGGRDGHREYDLVGNLTIADDIPDQGPRRGGVVARHHDEQRRLAEIELISLGLIVPTEGSVVFERRSDGQPLRISRPYGADTHFGYDTAGRQTSRCAIVDGACRGRTIELDAAGRAIAVHRANGTTQRSTWHQGRLVARSFERDGATEAALGFTYSNGLLSETADSRYPAPQRIERDATGRIEQIVYPGGENTTITYDLRSRVVREEHHLADGTPLRTLDQSYDRADRRLASWDEGTLVLQHSFAQGRLSSTATGGGLVRSYEYDETTGLRDRSTSVTPTGDPAENTTTGLSGACGWLAPVCVRQTSTVTAGLQAVAAELYGLQGPVTEGPLRGGGLRVAAYSQADGVWTSFEYDEVSNLTARGTNLHVYNAERNRLLEIRDAQGAPLVTYTYDASGLVTARNGEAIHYDAAGRVTAIGSEIDLAWDSEGRPLYRREGAEETAFLFGGRVETDLLGVPRRLLRDDLEIDLTTGAHRYPHRDFRGNVKVVSDDSGTVSTLLHYTPFGDALLHGAPHSSTTFAGGRRLGDLVLLGSRLLDPLAGRFLQPDPVLHPMNQYAYALGNPVTFWDPTGRYERPAGPAEQWMRGFGEYAALDVAVLIATLARSPSLQVIVASTLARIFPPTFALMGRSADILNEGAGNYLMRAAGASMGVEGPDPSPGSGRERGSPNRSALPDVDGSAATWDRWRGGPRVLTGTNMMIDFSGLSGLGAIP